MSKKSKVKESDNSSGVIKNDQAIWVNVSKQTLNSKDKQDIESK